jgi:hypothetical protein
MIFPLFLITTATAQAIDMPHTYTTLNQTIVRSMQYLCLYLSTSIIISISIGLPTNTLAKTFNAAQVVEIIEGDAPADAFKLEDVSGVAVVPAKAAGVKCARSWRYFDPSTADKDFPEITPRDAQAMREWQARA